VSRTLQRHHSEQAYVIPPYHRDIHSLHMRNLQLVNMSLAHHPQHVARCRDPPIHQASAQWGTA
jgi:hypothetical protein